MIMALLLASVGIGSAVNYLPESTMKPGADLSMFSGDPGNIEMWSGTMKNATWYPAPFPHSVTVVNDNGTYSALTGNGSVISQDIDPAPVIQAAVDYCESNSPGSVLLTDIFDTSTATITMDATKVSIEGVGPLSSGLYGTADPILNVTASSGLVQSTMISNMRIDTRDANDGVQLHGIMQHCGIDNVYFYGYHYYTVGNLLWADGWRMGFITDSYFKGRGAYPDGMTGVGINLTSAVGSSCLNIVISGCNIWGLEYGILIDGPGSPYTLIEGISLTGSTILGCEYSLYVGYLLEFTATHNMIDTNNNKVIFNSTRSGSIYNTWMGEGVEIQGGTTTYTRGIKLANNRIVGLNVTANGDNVPTGAVVLNNQMGTNTFDNVVFLVDGCNDLIVIGNRISGSSSGTGGGTYLASITDATNVTVSNNIFASTSYTPCGILFDDSKNIIFTDSVVTAVSGPAIKLADSSSVTISGNIINTSSAASADRGIIMTGVGCSDIIINQNRFLGGYYGIVAFGYAGVGQLTNIDIIGNQFSGTYNQQINIDGPKDTRISQNRFTSSGVSIRFSETYDSLLRVTVENNYIPASTSGTAIANAKLRHNFGIAGVLTEATGSSTGTGSEQTIAHGLMSTPKRVSVTPTVTGATVTWWADATNIYPTVTSGKTFNWAASTW